MDENWRDRFKNQYQHLKKTEGLTQEKLGDLVGDGVGQGTIGHWLTGRRTPQDLEQFENLAKALKLSPAFLLYGLDDGASKATGLLWKNMEKAYVFAKQVAIQYEVDSPAFEFIIMKWKYEQIEKEDHLNEVEKMAAFSKFMQSLDIKKQTTIKERS